MAGCYESGNENSGSMKCEAFLLAKESLTSQKQLCFMVLDIIRSESPFFVRMCATLHCDLSSSF